MTRVHGYRIGKWYGLLAEKWVALLPPSCAPSDAGRIWLEAEQLAGAALLEAVTSQLAARQEPFALVEFSPDGGAQVQVRGPVQVVVRRGEDRSTVVGGTQTVAERFGDATLVELRAPGAITSSPSLPLAAGVVRVETVSVSLGDVVVSAQSYQDAEVAAQAARTLAAPTPANPLSHANPPPAAAPQLHLANSFSGDDIAAIADSVTAEASEFAPNFQPNAAEDDFTVLAPTLGLTAAAEDEDDHTVLQPTLGLVGAGVGAGLSAADEGEDHTVLSLTVDQLGGGEADDDDTLISPNAARLPLGKPLGTPLGVLDNDLDGDTILTSDLPQLRAQMGSNSSSAAEVGEAPQIRVTGPHTITLSTGQNIALNRPVLIGRAPSVSRVSASTMPRLVSVASPKQDISRTHVEIRQDGDVVLVTDLSSTNGTILHVPGLSPRRLYPGMPTLMENDDIVDLGDGVTIRIEV